MRDFLRHLKSVLKISLVVVLLAALTFTYVGCKGNRVEVTTRSKPALDKQENAELEKAKTEAKARLDQANAALADLQGMGMDTSDLNEYINKAQTLYDNAKTPEEYMGITDSATYWANVVINFCHEKKVAYLAALAERNDGNEKDKPPPQQDTTPSLPDAAYHEGLLEVVFHPEATEEQARAVIARHKGTIEYLHYYLDLPEIPSHYGSVVRLPDGKDENEAVCEFLKEPLVSNAIRAAKRFTQ
jgi:hypothetical protein